MERENNKEQNPGETLRGKRAPGSQREVMEARRMRKNWCWGERVCSNKEKSEQDKDAQAWVGSPDADTKKQRATVSHCEVVLSLYGVADAEIRRDAPRHAPKRAQITPTRSQLQLRYAS